ncbi:hypothetical protein [Longimicrobium sp.]|uniref:RipA family octameric membrane protein n=1 Tax=Longimicrobium sp. TaxID=2029185 RepID=UPI002E370BC9|nr:hypothetical protein [Longimicrobium sp.]HEX6037693.1 hypothetical protein [Longimicrobium sp.]
MARQVSSDEYRDAFGVADTKRDPNVQKAALEHALDIRKFEIQLYWTRANYFWTFIAAALAAYGAIQTIDDHQQQTDLSVFLSCIGFVLSFGWYCANRGSKQWQENWENHVDLLEDGIVGPLYKTVLTRPNPLTAWATLKNFMTGPRPFSVSKINQIISLYISAIWLLLLVHALPPVSFKAPFSIEYTISLTLAAAATITIWAWGATQGGDFGPVATRREGGITEPSAVTSTTVGIREPGSPPPTE